MAIITKIDVDWDAKGKLHPTCVSAKIKVVRGDAIDGFVQVDTFGSQDRKFEGKISQTIQLDRTAAEELHRIIGRAFKL